MIRLIVFDLDGVLADSRELHFEALNDALREEGPHFVIDRPDHLGRFDGLPTTSKLHMLTKERQLPAEAHTRVWRRKQDFTSLRIRQTFRVDLRLQKLLATLKAEGYVLYCASNAIWTTMRDILLAKGLLPYLDYFASQEDVKRPKPHPDLYLHCIARAGVAVQETVICEDSPIGRRSALASGAHLCPIVDPAVLTEEKLRAFMAARVSPPPLDLRWKKPLNVVIPMAGLGSRFVRAGYTLPKPLIDVQGQPMIQRVVENLNVDAQFIYIVQREHLDAYGLGEILKTLTPRCQIVAVDGVTEGSACSVLLASAHIDNDMPLLIANCDQIVEWSSNAFLYSAASVDGSILTFHHPERDNKWSFVAVDAAGLVTEVREKVPISDQATVGIYYWSQGADFVKYAHAMIAANDRVNGEFYTAPVYNYALRDGKTFKTHQCQAMWGIGTPQDLEYYLSKHYLTKHSV